MSIKRFTGTVLAIIGISISLVFFMNAGAAVDEAKMGKGLKEATPEQLSELSKRKIKSVSANSFAIDRYNQDKSRKGRKDQMIDVREKKNEKIILESGEEYSSSSYSATSGTSGTESLLSAVPPQVDNSTMVAFPKIGNQSNQGSCVAWATTYYVMSHQVCLQLGCDNKNLEQNVFSPRWTYNMINGGVDGGSYFGDAFSLINLHGAAKISELPYSSGDYRSWSTNSDHWKNAINYRMTSAFSVQINTDAAMANVKQLLANGNILVIGTYITSWNYGYVKARPDVASPFAGQHAALYQSGTSGGHAMTVVGFDDEIWIDINANGVVESAELGAFKIANSWGAGWRNAGHIWVSYDAFRATSALSGFAPSGRNQLTQNGYAYYYNLLSPVQKLQARVTVSHARRSELSLQFASSSTSTLTPQVYFTPFALRNKGGAYAFDGSATEIESTFVFDISSVVSNTSYDQFLYYLIASDSVAGSTMTIRSFDIIDSASGAVIYSAADVPKLVDAGSARLIAGNYTPDLQAPSAPLNLSASLVSQRKGKRTTTSIRLSWQASTDNVQVSKYEIFRNGTKISETTSLSFSDTSSGTGTFNYSVRAVDTSGNISTMSNTATISK